MNGTVSRNSSSRVSARGKRCSPCARSRTIMFSRFFARFFAFTTLLPKDCVWWRWADMGAGFFFPTPTSTSCFFSAAKEPNKLSAGRTLEECKRIEEDNVEFHLALLDRRFLDGDAELFDRLNTKVLPGSEKQARPFLLAQ